MWKEAQLWDKKCGARSARQQRPARLAVLTTTLAPSVQSRLLKSSLLKSTKTPKPSIKTDMGRTPRQAFPDTSKWYAREARLGAVGFTAPERNSSDFKSKNDGGSERRQQLIYDAIQ
jgi:hypothetical protein